MLSGSCACGQVSYQISGPLRGPVTYCHCWRCRKHSGSSFGTTAGIDAADLTIITGNHRIAHWQSSPGIWRFFAGCCGSPIYKLDEANPSQLGFRLGTLDTDPEKMAELHFMVGSKAPWVELCDELPREEGGPAFGERD